MLQLWSSRKLAAWGSFRGHAAGPKRKQRRGWVKWGAVHVCVTPRIAQALADRCPRGGLAESGACQLAAAGRAGPWVPSDALGHSVPSRWRSLWRGQMCFQTCTCLGRGPVPRDPAENKLFLLRASGGWACSRILGPLRTGLPRWLAGRQGHSSPDVATRRGMGASLPMALSRLRKWQSLA